ncbi:butyrophilin subfamily 1 member A1-like isoform X5 [Pimephales promelas]|uniref:butyrophilin subfamily 1 member A1-like isoform X5 n=1 Tax=Pimephales promelas TaxID=90988 RepID=UPI0019558DBD|nr:butyrophilin subfamily 1 member A1-like isoform X5 [Pimephales promelas]
MLPIIFIIALLVNLLIETTESFTVVVPRDQTVARVGSTVTLPCWISPPENAEVLEIRWYRQEFSNPVLLYQNGKIIQEESFRNRSSLTLRSDQSGGLKDGDVSLRLEKLTVQDEGSFRCYVSGESVYDSRELVLKVIALGSAPVLFPQPLDDGRVNISCKSSGWYPEPDVSWTSDERTVLRPGGVSRSRGADEMFSVHSWTAVSHSDAQLVSCSISLKTGELREGRLSIKAIISSDPPDSSDPWMALFIIAFICVLGLIGFILYKYRHKLTGKKAVKKVCDDETMESLTKVRDDESMERGTKEDAGSSSSCAGAAAPHVHSQPSERKKTIKKVCDDETMESLTKVRDDESMERGTKEAVKDTNTEEQKKDTVGEQDSSNQEEKPTGLSPDQTSPSADEGSSSSCAGAAAPHVHSQPSERKKTIEKVCDDETMESLTKVRDDESMERETKEAVKDTNTEEQKKDTVGEQDSSNQEEKPTGLSPDQTSPSADAGSSSSCAGAAAPHVHSQPSERKKTIKKICEDETMESLTKVRDDESMERETKEAVKDTNTEEQKKDTVGEHDSSNQEEKPTGLSPDQTSPSADAGSSSWCAGAAAPHVHSQPSESVGDTNIAELRKHAVEITIDPKCSHPGLKVYPDRKTVRDAPDYKHTGKGFPYELCAVGAQRFRSERRYWEVDLALEDKPPKNYWLIGVTKHANVRAKDRSAVTPSNGYWFLCSDGPNGFYTSSDPPVSLSLTPRPERLGVLLDYGEGQLSFYNVKERKHVLTMNIRFPESVSPLFNPGVGDQSSLMILDCPEPVETPAESSDPLLRNSSDA